jgi:Predicted transcriptional regulators
MNRIRQLRQEKGWRQEDLAEQLNTKRQTVGNYETGERGIDMETICRICDIFGCTADYLLGRSSSPAPVISDEDAALLQAFHVAPPSVAAAIITLLQPYQKGNEADQVS